MYIQLYQLHGLLRSKNLELGLDEDTGGEIVYVLDLAKALANKQEVTRVEILTRLFNDSDHPGYTKPFEQINEKLGIVRMPCGPYKYLKKVELIDHLDEFYENAEYYISGEDQKPDIIHSNYFDSGYVCNKLSEKFNIPHIFSAHSLGKPKLADLQSRSIPADELNKISNFSKRIAYEQEVIENASKLILNCRQEKEDQYSDYDISLNDKRFEVIYPGINPDVFIPYWKKSFLPDPIYKQVNTKFNNILNKGLTEPDKPCILMLSRLEVKKNISNMVECYADDNELQEKTNLVIAAGKITDRSKLSSHQLKVLNNIESLITNYKLEGKVLLLEEVEFGSEVPELYRIMGERKGIFVDCDLSDPLPHTIIEAALCGLPVVANKTCALLSIISKGKSELLINVRKHHKLAGSILKLINNPELWEACSRNGVEAILEDLTWDISAKKLLNIYKEAIATQ